MTNQETDLKLPITAVRPSHSKTSDRNHRAPADKATARTQVALRTMLS